MSEDEIIERVEHFININVLYGKTYGFTTDDLTKYQQVFKGLLDLYNKEKEEKEELQEKLKEEMQIKNEYIDMLNATGKYSRIFKKDWED